jgi:hypothetical protein
MRYPPVIVHSFSMREVESLAAVRITPLHMGAERCT